MSTNTAPYYTLSLRLTGDRVVHVLVNDVALRDVLDTRISAALDADPVLMEQVLTVVNGEVIPPAHAGAAFDFAWERLERILDPLPFPAPELGLDNPPHIDETQATEDDGDICECPSCRARRQAVRIH